MKVFNNLLEATTYYGHCHACKKGKLVHSLEMETDGSEHFYKWNLSENVDSDTDDWIIVNAETNKIHDYQQSRNHDAYIYSIGTDSFVDVIKRRGIYASKPNKDGFLFESIHISCGTCRNFGYTIQIIMNMSSGNVISISLNSEYISYIGSDQQYHTVRNSFTFGKTEYVYSLADGSRKTITVPLIPIDLENPAETVGRVKKLGIFS